MLSYAQRKAELVRTLEAAAGERVALAKGTTNLFRDRNAGRTTARVGAPSITCSRSMRRRMGRSRGHDSLR